MSSSTSEFPSPDATDENADWTKQTDDTFAALKEPAKIVADDKFDGTVPDAEVRAKSATTELGNADGGVKFVREGRWTDHRGRPVAVVREEFMDDSGHVTSGPWAVKVNSQ
jgi:hypothetical protein